MILKHKINHKIIGVIGFIISIILIVLFSNIVLILLGFGERYFSHDHHIDEGFLFFSTYLILLILIILFSSLLSFFNIFRKAQQIGRAHV